MSEILNAFTFVKILNHDLRQKFTHILGSVKSLENGTEAAAVLLVEQLPLSEEQFRDLAANLSNTVSNGQNDIYSWLTANFQDTNLPNIKMTLIHPATDTHIRKYSTQSFATYRESPKIYQEIVQPYIESIDTKRIQWVYNILNGLSEQEFIIHSDQDSENGFVLLPDSKWDKRSLDTLYLTAIVRDRSLKSIRDLRLQHIQLLTNIQNTAYTLIPKLYNLPANQLRMFFHYQPSYYHLHVHIVHIKSQLNGVPLETVIDNLAVIDPDYYTKCTLTYQLGADHSLSPLLCSSDETNPAHLDM